MHRGFFLVEYLIYIAVLAVVMGVAFSAFYRCLDNSRALARNAEDILTTLSAGERWRQDIRRAVATPEIVDEGVLTACEIPTASGRVAYIFADGAVWRKDPEADARLLLPRVRSSRMVQDQRQHVTAWRWEVELRPKKTNVRLRPLFTFLAVPPREP